MYAHNLKVLTLIGKRLNPERKKIGKDDFFSIYIIGVILTEKRKNKTRVKCFQVPWK